ncbi:MAG: sodium:solute symporter [Phycisphaerae bacterium]|nr:sodium:solute symporter [Phycisphaerae bacterium]
MALAAEGFGGLDWVVLGLYFALLVGSGVWISRRVHDSRDYFLGGRAMPAWAVAISVLATSLSAATFIGGPQQAYEGDLTYLSATLGTILAAVVVAIVFLPAFYRHRVATVYELLEIRFGSGARRAASAMFMVGRVLASGARVYIAAHALSFIMWGDVLPTHLLIAVAALSVAGVVYTIAGGIESVIWADVVQTVVFVGAIVTAMVVLLTRIPAPVGEIVSALGTAGTGGESKLAFIRTTLDPSVPFTLWTALTGFTLFNLAALGTDQDLVQRMLTCRSALRASWSVISSQLIAIPVVLVFMVLGLLLFVYHKRPDLMGNVELGEAPSGKEVFLRFITADLPPGMSGLMIAGLFAIGLSSLNSALNAMASTFVSDFYRRWRPAHDEGHYLRAARTAVVVWGGVLGGFASFCVWWHSEASAKATLLEFALGVMVYAYTGLLAVFLCALFTRRGSTASVLAALAAGFGLTLAMEPEVFRWWTDQFHWSAATPETADGWRLGELRLAFPWRMVIATGGAFAVCLLGNRPAAKHPTSNSA